MVVIRLRDCDCLVQYRLLQLHFMHFLPPVKPFACIVHGVGSSPNYTHPAAAAACVATAAVAIRAAHIGGPPRLALRGCVTS